MEDAERGLGDEEEEELVRNRAVEELSQRLKLQSMELQARLFGTPSAEIESLHRPRLAAAPVQQFAPPPELEVEAEPAAPRRARRARPPAAVRTPQARALSPALSGDDEEDADSWSSDESVSVSGSCSTSIASSPERTAAPGVRFAEGDEKGNGNADEELVEAAPKDESDERPSSPLPTHLVQTAQGLLHSLGMLVQRRKEEDPGADAPKAVTDESVAAAVAAAESRASLAEAEAEAARAEAEQERERAREATEAMQTAAAAAAAAAASAAAEAEEAREAAAKSAEERVLAAREEAAAELAAAREEAQAAALELKLERLEATASAASAQQDMEKKRSVAAAMRDKARGADAKADSALSELSAARDEIEELKLSLQLSEAAKMRAVEEKEAACAASAAIEASVKREAHDDVARQKKAADAATGRAETAEAAREAAEREADREGQRADEAAREAQRAAAAAAESMAEAARLFEEAADVKERGATAQREAEAVITRVSSLEQGIDQAETELNVARERCEELQAALDAASSSASASAHAVVAASLAETSEAARRATAETACLRLALSEAESVASEAERCATRALQADAELTRLQGELFDKSSALERIERQRVAEASIGARGGTELRLAAEELRGELRSAQEELQRAPAQLDELRQTVAALRQSAEAAERQHAEGGVLVPTGGESPAVRASSPPLSGPMVAGSPSRGGRRRELEQSEKRWGAPQQLQVALVASEEALVESEENALRLERELKASQRTCAEMLSELEDLRLEVAGLRRYHNERAEGDGRIREQLQRAEHVAAAASAVAAAVSGAACSCGGGMEHPPPPSSTDHLLLEDHTGAYAPLLLGQPPSPPPRAGRAKTPSSTPSKTPSASADPASSAAMRSGGGKRKANGSSVPESKPLGVMNGSDSGHPQPAPPIPQPRTDSYNRHLISGRPPSPKPPRTRSAAPGSTPTQTRDSSSRPPASPRAGMPRSASPRAALTRGRSPRSSHGSYADGLVMRVAGLSYTPHAPAAPRHEGAHGKRRSNSSSRTPAERQSRAPVTTTDFDRGMKAVNMQLRDFKEAVGRL